MPPKSSLEDKDNYYISPKQFSIDLKEYYELSEAVEKLDPNDESKDARSLKYKCKKALEKCGVYLYKMAIGLSNNGRFSGYTWRDEMIGDALAKGNKALIGRKFDFSRCSNPFSYFNRIFWREFIRRIKIENKMTETKTKYQQEHYADFAEDTDVPIYVKKLYNIDDDIGSLWDDDMAQRIEQE